MIELQNRIQSYKLFASIWICIYKCYPTKIELSLGGTVKVYERHTVPSLQSSPTKIFLSSDIKLYCMPHLHYITLNDIETKIQHWLDFMAIFDIQRMTESLTMPDTQNDLIWAFSNVASPLMRYILSTCLLKFGDQQMTQPLLVNSYTKHNWHPLFRIISDCLCHSEQMETMLIHKLLVNKQDITDGHFIYYFLTNQYWLTNGA